MKKFEQIKELKKKVADLREQNTALHDICTQQRDSLAAQQETIVQLNRQMDSVLVCLCEVYGFPYPQADGSTKRQMAFPVDSFPDALMRCQVSAVKEDGQFVITVVPYPQDAAEEQEVAPEAEEADGEV